MRHIVWAVAGCTVQNKTAILTSLRTQNRWAERQGFAAAQEASKEAEFGIQTMNMQRRPHKEAGCQWSNLGRLWGIAIWSRLIGWSPSCSADRWGSRRWLTGWGRVATWPRRDYKQQEEGKEIRLKTEPAFLTSSLLSHWQHRSKLPSQHSISSLHLHSSTLPRSLRTAIHAAAALVNTDLKTSRNYLSAEEPSWSTDRRGADLIQTSWRPCQHWWGASSHSANGLKIKRLWIWLLLATVSLPMTTSGLKTT